MTTKGAGTVREGKGGGSEGDTGWRVGMRE